MQGRHYSRKWLLIWPRTYNIFSFSVGYWTYVEYASSCCHDDLLTSSALLSPRLGRGSGLSISVSAAVLAEGEGDTVVWMGEGMNTISPPPPNKEKVFICIYYKVRMFFNLILKKKHYFKNWHRLAKNKLNWILIYFYLLNSKELQSIY